MEAVTWIRLAKLPNKRLEAVTMTRLLNKRLEAFTGIRLAKLPSKRLEVVTEIRMAKLPKVVTGIRLANKRLEETK